MRLRRILLAGFLTTKLFGQNAFTWEQIKDKFEAANPTLKAAKANIEESKAAEITAYLRPNPDLTISTDGTQLSRYEGVWRPFAGTQFGPSVSYLHERMHKRELRRDQAKQSTTIAAQSSYPGSDLLAIGLFRCIARHPGATPRYDCDMQELERITIDPAVMGGKACIRGMRVTVGMIVEAIAAGRSVSDFLADSVS